MTDRLLTAIDRSPRMIGAAEQRNAKYVQDGRAEFLVTSLEDLQLGDRRFFHREPERARALVEPWLAPGGTVSAHFDPPVRAR